MKNMFVGWLIEGKWHACDNCEFTIENVTHWREIPPFPYEPEVFSEEQDLMVRRAQTLVESLVELSNYCEGAIMASDDNQNLHSFAYSIQNKIIALKAELEMSEIK